jgi:hypothetical protein
MAGPEKDFAMYSHLIVLFTSRLTDEENAVAFLVMYPRKFVNCLRYSISHNDIPGWLVHVHEHGHPALKLPSLADEAAIAKLKVTDPSLVHEISHDGTNIFAFTHCQVLYDIWKHKGYITWGDGDCTADFDSPSGLHDAGERHD